MQCRIGCGACCIAPSISSVMPLHPLGKPAAVRCLHLDADNKCMLFLHPDRPKICLSFQPMIDVCGENRTEALALLTTWETITSV